MALSGTKYGSVTYQPSSSDPFSFYFTWSATQNTDGNYSDVTVSTYWSTKDTGWTFDTVGTRNASITINGETTSISKRFNCAPWPSNPFLIQTATTRVYHNADGTKSISISVRANGHASSWGPSSSTASSADCTASETITLNTIPRASTITSASNITLGNACSIKWTPASSSFQYKINFSIGSWSYTTGYIKPSTTSAYTYTGYTISGTTTANSTTIYKQLPNSHSGTMTATLTTYNSSGTQIGESYSKHFTVTIPSSVKPKIGTITVDPVNVTTINGADPNVLLKDKNQITIAASNCSAGDGSTIKSYTFEVLSGSTVIAKSTTASTSVTLGPFSKTGNLKFRVTVTDNRDRSIDNSGSESTWECYDYDKPKFDSFNIYRAKNTNGTADMNGTYIRCNYVHTYSAVGGKNSATVTAYYNGKSQVGSNGAININLNGDNSTTYKVYLEIKDNYNGTYTTPITTIFGQARVLNITKNGTGVAIGKMAESNNLLECRWPAKLNDNCAIEGNLTVGTSTQSSTPTSGITVHDVRDANITPNSFGDKNANFYFDQIDSRWQGILHMKGWTGDYAAWELAGNAHNSSSDNTLKYRQGVGSTWGAWQTVITDKNIGNYVDQGSYLPLSGGSLSGTLTLNGGPLTLDDAIYYASAGKGGLDCRNSDIINANGIYFADLVDSAGEGINFYRSSGYWDTLYAKNGVLKFDPSRGTGTGIGGHTIYHSGNLGTLEIETGTCTLSSSSIYTINFQHQFSNVPRVMLTPRTYSSGAIPGKVRDISVNAFTAIIGGSAVSECEFMWVAIYWKGA